MPEITYYDNFDLLISAADDRTYALRVLTTPGGGGESATPVFVPAAGLEVLNDRLAAFRAQAADREGLRALGAGLFRWLFPPPLLSLYRASLRALGPGAGLRIRLRIEPSALHTWPWECCYDDETGSFLALDPRSVIVRYLPGPFTRHRPRGSRLNLLILAASPAGFEQLDLEGESRRIEDALDMAGGGIQVRTVAGTLDALQDALRDDPDLLHFIGHGGYDAAGGGFLWFEEEDRPLRVDGEALAALLRGSSVRIVVLNACESARSDPSDTFAGVAPRLVQAGVPAVVAMQAALLERAALQFSAAFYRTVAALAPLDMAVTAGRQALFAPEPEDPGWAAPVLFLSVSDAMLWEPTAAVVGQPTPAPTAAAPGGPSFQFNFAGPVTITTGQLGGERHTTIIHGAEEEALQRGGHDDKLSPVSVAKEGS